MATTGQVGGGVTGLQMPPPAPGSTPWWTDQQAQTPNVGGAGADYTQVQNPSTALTGLSPSYLSTLQQLGWGGGTPNTPQGYQDLASFIQGQGLTSKTSFLDQGGTGDQISALFDSSGNEVGGTQRQYASDVNSDAFGISALLGGGFAGAAAAGIGAGAAGGAGAGAGGGASTAVNSVNFVTDPAFLGEGGAATGVGGAGVGTSAGDVAAAAFPDAGTASGIGAAGTSITSGVGGATTYGTAGEALGTAAGGGAAGLGGIGGTGIGTSALGSLGQLASSLYGIYQGAGIKSSAAASDPFAAYRGQYAQQLQQLMQNPSSVTSLPGYQASQDAAEQALTRNLASQGLTGSGTAAEALAKEGAQFENQFYQQTVATLSGLAGANINNAGIALAGQAAGDNTINQSLQNLMKIWGSSGGTSAAGGGSAGSDWGSIISNFFGG